MKATPLLAAALAMIAAPALAHPGHATDGLAAGLAHPLLGADHLLAIACVGLWSGLRGERGALGVGAAFLAAMVAGAVAGKLSVLPPLAVEPLILASVLLSSLLLVAAVRMPTWAAVAVAALFGAVHGAAHGQEAPGGAAFAAFGLGMTATTAALIGGSIFAGRLCLSTAPWVRRLIGAGSLMAGVGLVLLGGPA